MKNTKRGMLLILMLSLYSCNLFLRPGPQSKPEPEPSPVTPFPGANELGILPQGTLNLCGSTSTGGAYPYSSIGPSWRQTFFLNDGSTHYNHHAFSTDLFDPTSSTIKVDPYTNASGGTSTSDAVMYEYVYAPPLTLTSTDGLNHQVKLKNLTATYGLIFRKSTGYFDLYTSNSALQYKELDGNLEMGPLRQVLWFSNHIGVSDQAFKMSNLPF